MERLLGIDRGIIKRAGRAVTAAFIAGAGILAPTPPDAGQALNQALNNLRRPGRVAAAGNYRALLPVVFRDYNSGGASVPPNGTPIPELTPTTPEPYVYNYDSGISLEDRRAIELGNTITDKYFLNTFGFKMRNQVIMDIKATAPPSNESSLYADVRDGRYRIVAYTVSDWQEKSSRDHTQQIIHERTHLMQDELSNGLTTSSHILRGPQWLLEGVAQYNGYRALVNEGYVTMDRVRECSIVGVTRAGPTPHLSEFETVFNPNGFSLSLLAVDNLVNRSGITSINAYYQLLTRMEWREAFNQVFGIRVEDFYTQFNQIHDSYPSHYGEGPNSCVIFPKP